MRKPVFTFRISTAHFQCGYLHLLHLQLLLYLPLPAGNKGISLEKMERNC